MQKIIVLILCWCLIFHACAQTNIIKAEYFIDVDPGFGSATNITITPSLNIINKTFSIPANSLTRGVHSLFIRSLDANGKWSVSSEHVFYNFGLPVSIVKAEYFIDNDPGFGNATNIAITPATIINNTTFNIPIGPLLKGMHTLFVRTKDVEGKWSVSSSHVFINFGTSLVTRAEYFIDTDPGFGNAIAINLTASSNITAGVFTIPSNTLLKGVHSLFIRSQDGNGNWSITNQRVYFNFGASDSITRCEYFIDSDPGFGNGVPISFNPATNIQDFIAQVNISGLSAGTHQLYVRSKTNSKWSVTNEYDFPVTAPASAPYININSVSKKVLCAGTNFRLSYDARGTYNTGNTFTAQLSNENGSFSNPLNIGQVTTTTSSNELICTLPSPITEGSNYRIRMVSSNPVLVGAICDTLFSIHMGSSSQIISGNSDVNAGYNYPYSVPFINGSSWLWIAPSATISQTANNANLNWNTVGQPQSLTVYETNQYGCIGGASTKNVNVYPLKITNVNPSLLSLCPGSSLNITANVYGVYYPGNIFTAQLSNATGSFASPVVIGTYIPATQPLGNAQPITINATIPASTSGGSNYRIRVTGSNYSVTSDTSAPILINRPAASFSINNISQCHGGNNFIFTNLSTISSGTMTFKWDFADNSTSTVLSPSHIYLATGNYTVKLVATSNLGCKDSISTNVTVTNCGVYTFIGNGDWNTPSNWLNSLVPPTTIPNNMNITISPTIGGQCYYIGTITLQAGGIITVVSGKAFNVRLQ